MATTNLGRVSVVPKGAWSSSTNYKKLDIVTSSGSSYIALSDNSNKAVTNTTYWQLIASKGDTGATGETGATGATGATGNGIASIEKTDTTGLVDTYTITYTNGNTTTFTVTNGEVSQAELDATNERLARAELIYNVLPKITDEGTSITLEDTVKSPLDIILKPSNLTQATNILTYTCDGSETGIYYFVYDGTYYEFTMPTITSGSLLYFNTDTLKLYLGDTEITTAESNNGSLLTLITTPNIYYPQNIVFVAGDNELTLANEDDTETESLTVTLGDIEFCRIGNYSDRFFKNISSDPDYSSSLQEGKWYLKKLFASKTFDGTETFTKSSSSTSSGASTFYSSIANYLEVAEKTMICNYFQATINENATDLVDGECCFRHTGTPKRIYLCSTHFSTGDEVATWLGNLYSASKPLIIYYVLQTPTYTLLSETLQEELDNIYELCETYEGETNITQTNDSLPFVIKATALKDISNLGGE